MTGANRLRRGHALLAGFLLATAAATVIQASLLGAVELTSSSPNPPADERAATYAMETR